MLSVERLDVAYGGSQVVWSVDLDVPDGQVVCLMGRNGVGKTTLLKSLMGLVPIKTGTIEFNGAPIHGATPTSTFAAGHIENGAPIAIYRKT